MILKKINFKRRRGRAGKAGIGNVFVLVTFESFNMFGNLFKQYYMIYKTILCNQKKISRLQLTNYFISVQNQQT